MLLFSNAKYVSSLLIYSHTTGTFESQDDAALYLGVFSQTIQETANLFPGALLYYIQNNVWI